jgi:hypothetical protein
MKIIKTINLVLVILQLKDDATPKNISKKIGRT